MHTCINKSLHSPSNETFIHHPGGPHHALVMTSDSAPFSFPPVTFLSSFLYVQSSSFSFNSHPTQVCFGHLAPVLPTAFQNKVTLFFPMSVEEFSPDFSLRKLLWTNRCICQRLQRSHALITKISLHSGNNAGFSLCLNGYASKGWLLC